MIWSWGVKKELLYGDEKTTTPPPHTHKQKQKQKRTNKQTKLFFELHRPKLSVWKLFAAVVVL